MSNPLPPVNEQPAPEKQRVYCHPCEQSYLAVDGAPCPQCQEPMTTEEPGDHIEDQLNTALANVEAYLETKEKHPVEVLLAYAQTLALVKIGLELERLNGE